MNPYVLSLLNPGCKWGENRVLTAEKKRIPGFDPWMGLWALVLDEVFIGALLTWEVALAPYWTPQKGEL